MRKRLKAFYRETAYGWWVFFGTTIMFSYAFRDQNAWIGVFIGLFFGAPSLLAFNLGRNLGIRVAAPLIIGYLLAFLIGSLSDSMDWAFKLSAFGLLIPPAIMGTALGELSSQEERKGER